MNKFGYKCPECSKGIIQEKEIHNYSTKIDNYQFIVPKAIVGICNVCGSINFDPTEREKWLNLYKKELESKQIVLSSKEIVEIRKVLGLSMEQFAHLTGCTRQSIYNWENKNRKIPQSRMADLILRLLKASIYKGKINTLEFLLSEVDKLGVKIKIKEDITGIVSSEEYIGSTHPAEEYARNFSSSKEPMGFSPRLKNIS